MTAGAMTIEQVDKVDFWEEIEAQLEEMVSETGRLVVNRSIYRQVDIEVKIVQRSVETGKGSMMSFRMQLIRW